MKVTNDSKIDLVETFDISTIAWPSHIIAIFELIDSVEKREADPMHNSYALYGWNYMPYKYGSGFYMPSLAHHKYNYGYVAGYGPRAYSYTHRAY